MFHHRFVAAPAWMLATALLAAVLPAYAATDAVAGQDVDDVDPQDPPVADAAALPTIKSEILVTSSLPELATERRVSGGELLLRQRLSDVVSWRGSLAYVRGEDEALDEPVLGVAPLTGEVGVRFHFLERRLWLDLAGRFADRQDRVAASRFEQETPGWAIVGLSAGWQLPRGVRLTAAVDNLTDRAYAEHLNSPNPFTRERVREIGRNVRLGVALEF